MMQRTFIETGILKKTKSKSTSAKLHSLGGLLLRQAF